MKVTALIPEDIIAETKKFTGGKNITESLLIALRASLKTPLYLLHLEKN